MADISLAPSLTDTRLAVTAPPIEKSAAVSQPAARSTTRRDSDRAEFSDMALYMSQLKSLPDVRTDLVDRVRSEIASGIYDSDEKLNAALDALLDDINQTP